MNDVGLLRQVPIFSQMDDAELAGLSRVMSQQCFIAGQGIIHEGEDDDDFYVLVTGQAQVLVLNAEGKEVVVEDVGPGGFFGEMSMLTNEPRSATVRAVTAVTTLRLARQAFFDFLTAQPHAALGVLTVLSHRLSRTSTLLRQTVSRNVNEVADDRLTLGQRIADGVAGNIGSWRFIILQTVVVAAYLLLNVTAWLQHWDPYPFILLNLVLAFQSAYAGPFIMMSQNRESDKDRLAAEIDHQVNSKAEVEVGLILRRLDELERQICANHEDHQAQLRALRPWRRTSRKGPSRPVAIATN